jgi:dTDP-3,4-didehydro-2,6-dideoxy-alpha-D-glucose 3-reductase
MLNKKLNIGVLGIANIARRSVIPAIRISNKCQLYGIASRDFKKAQEYGEKYDVNPYTYSGLLDDSNIDAIYLPLPTGLHESWVTKALEGKKHVLVEKSFASDYKTAQRLIQLARDQNVLVMENYMFLHHSQHQAVNELLNDGTIGDLRLFRSTFCFPPLDPENFRYNRSLGGGALLDAAGYTIRAATQYLGKDLAVEGAYLTNQGRDVDIMGSAILSNDANQVAQLFFGFDNYYQCNYELFGTKGKILASRAFTPPPEYKPKIFVETEHGAKEYSLSTDNHFLNIVNAFCETTASMDYDKHYSEILTQSKLIESIKEKAINV